MRITGGSLKGRLLERPNAAITRPISSMTCQALFNVLGPIDGLVVLDAYAGSGAIGLEALSRGAGLVEGVEANKTAAKVLQNNVANLGQTERYIVTIGKIEDWLTWQSIESPAEFDLIIAGPPFAKLDGAVLVGLSRKLKDGGTIVVWHSSRLAPPELESLKLVQSKTYGDSALSFYKR